MSEFKYLNIVSPTNEYINLEKVYQLKRIADILEKIKNEM